MELHKKVLVAVAAGFLLTSAVGAGVGVSEHSIERDDSVEQDTKIRYESVVIFRNDDVQPYYRTEAQRNVDEIFVEEQVPVTQSVIPAPQNESVVPEQEFCGYLTDQRQRHPEIFDYALHGFNHQPETTFDITSRRYYSGPAKSEFVDASVSKQREKIEEGTEALKACVGERPEVFVPPFGTYSDETVAIAREQGYRAISGGSWYTEHYYNVSHDEFPFTTNGLLHVPRTAGFVANWTTGEFYSLDTLKYRFDETYEDNGLHVQMIHSPLFTDDEKLQRLRAFIDYVKGHEGVKFMTLSEFARSYESGRLERVEGGWVYEPPESDGEGAESDDGSSDSESGDLSSDSRGEGRDARAADRS